MRNFMKQIHTILYSMYEILMYFIVGIMLVSLSIIIMTNSWHYLILYIPALLYIYRLRSSGKNSHWKGNEKS